MKAACISLFFFVAAGSASSQTVYVIGQPTEAGATTRFGTLNLQTGAYTKIADLTTGLRGIATGTDGTLYGLAGDFDQYLYRVSSTGVETLIGATGTSLANGSNDGFGVAYDGSLYLRQGSNLYSVNSTTAKATLVGNMGIGSTGQFAGAPSGKLYTIASTFSQDLYEVNRTTGATTYIGSTSGRGALVYVNSAMFNIDGSAFGSAISSVNIATGASSPISTYDRSKAGVISSAATIATVPEPCTLLALAAGGLGLLRRRRTQR